MSFLFPQGSSWVLCPALETAHCASASTLVSRAGSGFSPSEALAPGTHSADGMRDPSGPRCWTSLDPPLWPEINDARLFLLRCNLAISSVSQKAYRLQDLKRDLLPSLPPPSFCLSVFPSFLSVLTRFHDVAGPEWTTYVHLLHAGTTGEPQSWAKSDNLPLCQALFSCLITLALSSQVFWNTLLSFLIFNT